MLGSLLLTSDPEPIMPSRVKSPFIRQCHVFCSQFELRQHTWNKSKCNILNQGRGFKGIFVGYLSCILYFNNSYCFLFRQKGFFFRNNEGFGEKYGFCSIWSFFTKSL